MDIIKRDGRIENADCTKISSAFIKATNGKKIYDKNELNNLAIKCLNKIERKYGGTSTISVETIHDEVIRFLKRHNLEELANNYSEYRNERNKTRMKKTTLMKAISAIGIESDRDNANVGNNYSSKLLRIASESNKCSVLSTLPKELAREHEICNLHYHDLDSYNIALNCLHIPVLKILSRGFDTGYGWLRKPKRIESAANLLCILIQSVQNK